jgi:transcription elongation factor Elf1
MQQIQKEAIRMTKKVFVTLACGHTKVVESSGTAMSSAATTTCAKCSTQKSVKKWH